MKIIDSLRNSGLFAVSLPLLRWRRPASTATQINAQPHPQSLLVSAYLITEVLLYSWEEPYNGENRSLGFASGPHRGEHRKSAATFKAINEAHSTHKHVEKRSFRVLCDAVCSPWHKLTILTF